MTWWERINLLIQQKGITAAELARRSGVHEKTIYKYLDGKTNNPRGDTLHRIARTLDVSEVFLRYGEPSRDIIKLTPIPLLTLSRMGKLVQHQSYKTVWDGVSVVSVSEQDLGDGDFGVRIDNESCSPDISPGDIVICNTEAPVHPGRYIIAIAAGRSHFGRYRPSDHDPENTFQVHTVNEDYPSVSIGGDNPGFIYARAIRHIRDI